MKNIPEAYELVSCEELPDLRSKGSVLLHKKSGARLAILENDDENKVFYIGFRTPAINSCGTAHIIEHSVLCGSEKYPIKDPFVELAKGSMNTFLNAMTYPDKTVYPVASTNDKDFANLMDVYMDAVLHPNIAKHPEIFQQEGWHYELEKKDGAITINGVVYNEMKGAFSSPDDVLSRTILNSLFPDITYQYESGGDPDDIPDLTYEQFLDFHQMYYHPSNSYIYLYGDLDMEERLRWLDEAYLSDYGRLEVNSEVIRQEPFGKPVHMNKPYPIASGDDDKDAAYLSYNLVIGDILDAKLYTAFELLDYVLLTSPGAPIHQALVDAGIGKDILGGYDNGTLQPIFSVIAKGTERAREKEFVDIIRRVCKEQAEGALDHESVLAVINRTEFRVREADFSGYPKGLMYGLTALDSWLYDERVPFLHLDVLRILDELKEDLKKGYFEDLIQKYLLDNSHASVVTIEAQKGLTREREEALRKKLADYKATLSETQLEELITQTLHLKEYQATPSTQEELMMLPVLSREDLKREEKPLRYEEKSMDGVKVIYTNTDTCGISYLSLLFELDGNEAELSSELSLFSRLLGLVDTDSYSYTEFAKESNLHTGGISVDPRLYGRDDGTYRLFIEVRVKYLYSEEEKALKLLEEMMLHSDFSDQKRLKELLFQEGSAMQQKMMTAGHSMSASRVGSYFRESLRHTDEISGVAYYEYVKDFSEHFEERIEEFRERCGQLVDWLFRKKRLIVSLTAQEQGFGSLRERLPDLIGKLSTGDLVLSADKGTPHRNEGITTAAQIAYVSRGGSYLTHGFAYSGYMKVLRVILNYEYFWINIRVKGGAYGCMSNFGSSGYVLFSSYRDPNVSKTSDIFERTPDYLEDFSCSERDMTKYVIGAVSVLDSPLTPSMEGHRNMVAYLTGKSFEKLQKERDEVLSCTDADIRGLADAIRAAMGDGLICTIGNEDMIEADKDLFEEVRNI